jgi:hypothetical protein
LHSFQSNKENTMKPWIRKMSAVTLSLAGFGFFAGGALAQGPAELGDGQQKRVDNRQARQSDRITQGVASGELTEREQARLERQQNRIQRLEGRTEADGRVTAPEAIRIERAQDRASRNIYRQKHDRQRGG